MGNIQPKLKLQKKKKKLWLTQEKNKSMTCEICMEAVLLSNKRFINKKTKCSHRSFCVDCIAKYIQVMVEENNTYEIKCPDLNCDKLLDPISCRTILPPRVFNRWHSETMLTTGTGNKNNNNNNNKMIADANDILFLSLIKKNKWTTCPNCNQSVELVSGCSMVTCRCRTTFCHDCGRKLSSHRCPCKENARAQEHL